MPLGLMQGMTYEEKEATLEQGESVLLHSDGVVESYDPDREMFGFPRLRQLVAHHRAGETMIASLLLELDGFMSGEHDDDITLLTLTRATTPGGDGRAGSGSLPRLPVGARLTWTNG